VVGARCAAWGGAIGAARGVWGARSIGMDPIVWYASACVVLSLVPLVLGRARGAAMVLAVALVMGGWAQTRTATRDPMALDALVGAAPAGETVLVRVRAVVLERVRVTQGRRDPWDPAFWEGRTGRALARIEALRVGDAWTPARGRVRLVLGGSALGAGIGAGDRIEALGSFRRVRGARNPGEPDWAALARQDGIAGTLVVRGAPLVELVGRAGAVRALRAAVRGRAIEALGLDGPGANAEPWRVVLGALVLGERTAGGRGLERSLARVGVAHALAVSGLHVGIVLGAGLVLVRLTGERPRAEALVLALLVLSMLTLVPVRVPIARAMALFGALALTRSLGRRADALTLLGWVALALLVWRPLDALALGYQLSVAVTALLVRLGARDPGNFAQAPRPRSWSVRRVLGVNGACWALATPIVMVHTGVVSLTGAVASVPAALGAALVLLVGSAQVLVGIVSPELADSTRWIAQSVARVGADAVVWLDDRPWSSVRGVNPGAWWGIGASAWVWFVLVHGRGARRAARRAAGAALLALLVWGGASHLSHSWVRGVRVDTLDVGDGGAHLIRSGRGVVLYDAGSLSYRAASMIDRAAHALGVRRVRDAVVSHDNIDHFNALPALASTLGIERVHINPAMDLYPSRAWAAARASLESSGVEVRVVGRGDSIAIGEASLAVIRAGDPSGRGLAINDTSVVCSVTLGAARVLMTGDAGAAALAPLIEGPDAVGRADVLEAPHHGSWGAASEALIERAAPRVVLQSTGPGRVGDPRWSDHARERVWLVTAPRGAVWVRVSRSGRIDHGAARAE